MKVQKQICYEIKHGFSAYFMMKDRFRSVGTVYKLKYNKL